MSIKIIDFSTTTQGALRLLLSRVKKINEGSDINNIILCPEGPDAEVIRNSGVQVKTIDVTRGLGILNIIKESIVLFKTIKSENPDIIHTHNSKAGAIGRIICWMYNFFHQKKMIIIHQVHGFHFTKYNGIKRKIFYIIERILGLLTDILLFQNRYEYELAYSFNLKKCKLIYISNGINFDEFNKIDKKKSNENIKKIICVARIEPVKNHVMLIEALNILEQKHQFKNYKLYLIGEGDRELISDKIKKYRLTDKVVFTGKLDRDEIKRYLASADISVLSSIKEGKPRSIMESMYFGIPCIATDVIGSNELIENGKNGYLVPLNNHEMMADRIYDILNDNTLAKKISENARKYCLEHCDENKVVDYLKKIYLEEIEIRKK